MVNLGQDRISYSMPPLSMRTPLRFLLPGCRDWSLQLKDMIIILLLWLSYRHYEIICRKEAHRISPLANAWVFLSCQTSGGNF